MISEDDAVINALHKAPVPVQVLRQPVINAGNLGVLCSTSGSSPSKQHCRPPHCRCDPRLRWGQCGTACIPTIALRPHGLHRYMANVRMEEEIAERKGAWEPWEDELLASLIKEHGAAQWSAIASHIPGRTGKSCRLRWCNQLNPAVKRGPFTQWEDAMIVAAWESFERQNKWAAISKFLVGRTDNGVKNHWNSTLKRQYLDTKNYSNAWLDRHNYDVESLRAAMPDEEHDLTCNSAEDSMTARSTHSADSMGTPQSVLRARLGKRKMGDAIDHSYDSGEDNGCGSPRMSPAQYHRMSSPSDHARRYACLPAAGANVPWAATAPPCPHASAGLPDMQESLAMLYALPEQERDMLIQAGSLIGSRYTQAAKYTSPGSRRRGDDSDDDPEYSPEREQLAASYRRSPPKATASQRKLFTINVDARAGSIAQHQMARGDAGSMLHISSTFTPAAVAAHSRLAATSGDDFVMSPTAAAHGLLDGDWQLPPCRAPTAEDQSVVNGDDGCKAGMAQIKNADAEEAVIGAATPAPKAGAASDFLPQSATAATPLPFLSQGESLFDVATGTKRTPHWVNNSTTPEALGPLRMDDEGAGTPLFQGVSDDVLRLIEEQEAAHAGDQDV